MRVAKEFDPYNFRRYGKPWIAKVVNWPVGGSPKFQFGSFVGTADNGGFAEIDAEEGDVIAYGQRDYRGRNTTKQYATVVNGEIVPVDMTVAREKLLDKPAK